MNSAPFHALAGRSISPTQRGLIGVFAWSVISAAPLTTFDPSGELLRAAPIEYATLLLFVMLGLVHFSGPAPKVRLDLSGYVLVGAIAATGATMALALLQTWEFQTFRVWGTQLCLRGLLVAVVASALTFQPSALPRLVALLAWTNLIVATTGAVMIAASGDLGFFREGASIYTGNLRSLLENSVFSNPNALGRFLLLTLPFAAVTLRMTPLTKYCVAVPLNLLVILSTESRTCLVLACLQVGAFLPLRKRLSLNSIALGVVACMGISVIAWHEVGAERFQNKADQYLDHGTTIRLEMFLGAYEAAREKPWSGHGPGTSADLIDRNFRVTAFLEGLGREDVERLTLHNSVLLILVEYGAIAAAVYVAGMLMLQRSVWRRLRNARSSVVRHFYLACALALASHFVSGMTAAHFGENMGWFVVGMSLFGCTLPQEVAHRLLSPARAANRYLPRCSHTAAPL